MANIFEVTDPRGFKVVCSEESWSFHILASHPSMQGWEDDVKAVIQSPTMGIYQDANRPERCIYYKLNKGKARYIKVVVSFDQQNFGHVITALATSSPKAGEKLIWP